MLDHATPARLRIAAPTGLALLAAFAAFASGASAQTTVSLPCMRDNTLYEDLTGSLSNGAGTGLFAGVVGTGTKRRALLRFDVGANVPSGARIVSAVLTITVAQSTFAGILPITGHRVLQNWGEGTSISGGGGGGGGLATLGDATWLHTFWATATWTNAGGDFAAAPSFTIASPALGPGSSSVTAQALADVQTWLDTPSQNFGWLLKTGETLAFQSRRIDSREQSLGTPPVLQVTYITQGQSAPWGQSCLVGGQPFAYGMVGAPIGGTTVQMVQGNGPPGSLAANLVALGYDPVGTPLLPQCSLYLPLGPGLVTQSLLFLGNTGTGSTPVNLPAGFPGVTLVWQTAAIDPGPAGFVLGNAVVSLLQ